MKKTIITLFILLFSLSQFSRCKKDNGSGGTSVTPTKTEILVSKTWQIDEVFSSVSGTNYHYLKGASGNTGANYDLTRITFNANGTGSYTSETGITNTTTWQFITTDERNLRLVINSTPSSTVNWNLLEITSNAFHHCSAVGSNILVAARYKPI